MLEIAAMHTSQSMPIGADSQPWQFIGMLQESNHSQWFCKAAYLSTLSSAARRLLRVLPILLLPFVLMTIC